MGKGQWRQAQLPLRLQLELGGESIGTTNHKNKSFVLELLQPPSKGDRSQALPLFHQGNQGLIRT